MGGPAAVGVADPGEVTDEELNRMRADAAARDLTVEVRERPRAKSLAEAAELLGIEPADIAKTMVVRLPGDRYVFAVVGGDTQIAWPKKWSSTTPTG